MNACLTDKGLQVHAYKYGVYQDTVLEIVGRTDQGTWVLVQAVGALILAG